MLLLMEESMIDLKKITKENRYRIENDDALAQGYQLNSKYEICYVIYSGDNGFVYKAKNNFTKDYVAIKEFYPRESIEYGNQLIRLKRNKSNQALELDSFTPKKYEQYIKLLNRFLQEAERLKEFSMNKYVIDVNDCFEANNTGYIVLDYIDYPTLSELITSEELITAQDIIDIYMLLLKSVEEIHEAGMIHRDIKPSNLFVMRNKIVIGDFGISKYKQDINKSNTICYSENYASPEQKIGSSTQGTWSDIYSLGKTLEYLILHLGYKNGSNIRTKQEAYELGLDLINKIVDRHKISDIISKSCEESPKFRLQKVDEVKKLIDKKHKRLTIKKIILPSLAILSAGLLFFTLLQKDAMITNTNNVMNTSKGKITYINDSSMSTDMDDKPSTSNESKDEIINTEQVAFITPKNSTFNFSDAKLVEWSNPHDFAGYIVSIMNTSTWQIEAPQFYVHGTSFDLDTLGLNPANYRLMLFVADPNNKFAYMKYFDFIVSQPMEEKLLSPVSFDTDFYSYHISDDKYIDFYPNDGELSYQVSLIDYYGPKKIITKEIKEQRININDMFNDSGYYSLIVQSKKDKQISEFAKVDISIVKDDIPKRATFNIRNNSIFPYYGEKKIEWSNMDDPIEIYMELTHIVSGQTIKKSFDKDIKNLDLDSLELKMGAYECTLSYLTDNTMSPLSKVYFAVLPPYLPAVIINNDAKLEWDSADEKLLSWSPAEKANTYFINFYKTDSQETIANLSTNELFIDFTDTLEKGTYRVEVSYKDIRDNESEKNIIEIKIN